MGSSTSTTTVPVASPAMMRFRVGKKRASGSVPGGCSAINGMIYIRGHARDYDQWRQMGLAGWGYAQRKYGSAKAAKDFFAWAYANGDGMAEELINTLAKVKSLKVPARTSTFAYKGRAGVDVKQVARELGVLDRLDMAVGIAERVDDVGPEPRRRRDDA